jgi:putative SOS response-associated peptidase YedK
MIIIGQASSKQSYESHLEVSFSESQEFEKRYCIDRGQSAWVISCKDRNHLTQIHYGMIPFSSSKMDYHYLAPIEGSINPDAEMIKKRMITHPAYRRPIRETRCLVPVDYFITVAAGGQPYLIYSMESRPFVLAGIFDTWKAAMKEKDLYYGFALLTSPASVAFREVGIERMPVALEMRQYKKWLNPQTPLLKITKYVDPPEENFLNGFPVNKSIFDSREDSREICRPAGVDVIEIKNIDFGKIWAYLKSFRYKRGVTHRPPNEDRIWRKSDANN